MTDFEDYHRKRLVLRPRTRVFVHPAYFSARASVTQSFGFASELLLGPELALLPMNHRESLAKPRRPEGRRRGRSPGPTKPNAKGFGICVFSPAELEAIEDEHD
jgi:hypothetical protein